MTIVFEIFNEGEGRDCVTEGGEDRRNPDRLIAFTAIGLHTHLIGRPGIQAGEGVGRSAGYRNRRPLGSIVLTIFQNPVVVTAGRIPGDVSAVGGDIRNRQIDG